MVSWFHRDILATRKKSDDRRMIGFYYEEVLASKFCNYSLGFRTGNEQGHSRVTCQNPSCYFLKKCCKKQFFRRFQRGDLNSSKKTSFTQVNPLQARLRFHLQITFADSVAQSNHWATIRARIHTNVFAYSQLWHFTDTYI